MKKNILNIFIAIAIVASTSSLEAKAHISKSAAAHIKERHWHDSNSKNTSRFNRSMTDKKLNALATKTLNKGRTSNSKQGNGRKVHEYTFKKPIGKTSNGQKARTMQVVTDGKGNVVTAFPKK